MKIVIMQPYFLPYIGYVQLLAASDIFVSLDDVNYIKKGWINRNNLVFNGSRKLFSVPLSKASQNRLICDTMLSDIFPEWRDGFMKSLGIWYGKEEFFNEGFQLVREILFSGCRSIAELNVYAIRKLARLLGINTKITSSSETGVPRTKGSSRLVALCRHLGADIYINAPGGKELYCEDMFIPHGIDLRFLVPGFAGYPMRKWIPGLSILDPIMRIGIARTASELVPCWHLERGRKTFGYPCDVKSKVADGAD